MNYFYETNYSIVPREVPAENDIEILRKLAPNKEITIIYEGVVGGRVVWDKKMKVISKPIEIKPSIKEESFPEVKKELPKFKASKLEK